MSPLYVCVEDRGRAKQVRPLPLLLLLCVCAQVRDPATNTTYVVAKARLEALPGAVPKKKAGGGKKKGGAAAAGEEEAAGPAGFEVLGTFKGAELVGAWGGKGGGLFFLARGR